MVFILPSGEVVPDSDPRAKAARQQRSGGGGGGGGGGGSGGSSSRWGASGGRGSIHGGTTGGVSRASASPSSSSSSAGASNPNPNSAHGGALFTDGRLAPVARMLGVEGRYFTTPRVDFLDVPSTQLPIVFALVLLVLTYVAGWRVLMLAVILWFVYHAQNAPSAPATAARGAGRRAR